MALPLSPTNFQPRWARHAHMITAMTITPSKKKRQSNFIAYLAGRPLRASLQFVSGLAPATPLRTC